MSSVLSFSVITLQDEGDSNDSDDEENNWPELRYGIYKNPTPGPSWREDDEVSPPLDLLRAHLRLRKAPP